MDKVTNVCVVVAQIRVRAACPEKNLESILRALKTAQALGARLVIFPELAIPGYFVGDSWERPDFLRACVDCGEKIVQATAEGGCPAVIFGNIAVDPLLQGFDGRVRKYNAAFVAESGKLLHNSSCHYPFWPKTLLPNYREFDDARHFFSLSFLALERNVPRESLLSPVKVAGLTVGLGICEDAWSDDYGFSPYTALPQKADCDFFVNLSASPFTLGKDDKRERVFSKLSKNLNRAVVYANPCGVQNTGKTVFTFDGSSRIFQPQDEKVQPLVPELAAFDEDILAADFNTGLRQFTLSKIQANIQTLSRELKQESQPKIDFWHSSSTRPEAGNRAAWLTRALTYGIDKCLEEWRLKRVIVAVSGGIDSAVSAALFRLVLPPESIYLVNFPSRFNSELTRSAARKLALNLGCALAEVPIENEVTALRDVLENTLRTGFHLPDAHLSTLAAENIQARERGSRLLAGLGALLDAVFPCNSNKAELSVGYSTLYGDMTGFLAPIGDLWKGDVYAVGRYINNEIYGRDIIPQEIFDVRPSAELSAAQDITQGLGDPLHYPYHDALLRTFVESWDRTTPETILKSYLEGALGTTLGISETVIQSLFPTPSAFVRDLELWWSKYTEMGAVKRVQAPPVLCVTRRSFGTDHRDFLGPTELSSAYRTLRDKAKVPVKTTDK